MNPSEPPGNPQPTPRQPPGNPLGTANRIRRESDQLTRGRLLKKKEYPGILKPDRRIIRRNER